MSDDTKTTDPDDVAVAAIALWVGETDGPA